MDGLTAKVFRTYNASHTLQQQLDKLASQGTRLSLCFFLLIYLSYYSEALVFFY